MKSVILIMLIKLCVSWNIISIFIGMFTHIQTLFSPEGDYVLFLPQKKSCNNTASKLYTTSTLKHMQEKYYYS